MKSLSVLVAAAVIDDVDDDTNQFFTSQRFCHLLEIFRSFFSFLFFSSYLNCVFLAFFLLDFILALSSCFLNGPFHINAHRQNRFCFSFSLLFFSFFPLLILYSSIQCTVDTHNACTLHRHFYRSSSGNFRFSISTTILYIC